MSPSRFWICSPEVGECREQQKHQPVDKICAQQIRSTINSSPEQERSSGDRSSVAASRSRRHFSAALLALGLVDPQFERNVLDHARPLHVAQVWLKSWAMQIARRRGMKKAIVALARRLAVIMHRIWVDGTEFRWTREQATAPA